MVCLSSTRPARWAVLLTTLALAASVFAVSAQSDEASAMAVEVAGLEPGAVVTENELAITVTPVGYELSANAGTPPAEGEGHHHVVLDDALVNMYTTPDAVISLQNVAPGPHTLVVVPAMIIHMPVT